MQLRLEGGSGVWEARGGEEGEGVEGGGEVERDEVDEREGERFREEARGGVEGLLDVAGRGGEGGGGGGGECERATGARVKGEGEELRSFSVMGAKVGCEPEVERGGVSGKRDMSAGGKAGRGPRGGGPGEDDVRARGGRASVGRAGDESASLASLSIDSRRSTLLVNVRALNQPSTSSVASAARWRN